MILERFEDDGRSLSTYDMYGEIEKCENIDELREHILPRLKSRQEQWTFKIKEILTESGYSKVEFAKKCKVARKTLDSWLSGSIPKERERYLRIGLLANYDQERMNHLLQRYGQFSGLYSKSLDDCVCIYVIENYDNDRLEKYDEILERMKEKLNLNRENIGSNSGRGVSKELDTIMLEKKISSVRGEDELDKFISENSAVFMKAYHKLYAYLQLNIEDYGISDNNLAEYQHWPSTLRTCVSEINQEKWYPTRNMIISLGLHLSMDYEQMDTIFEYARMEPLCPKNVFESAVIYILESAERNGLIGENDEYCDNPDAILAYARDVLEELDIPEVTAFLKQLPEGEGDEDEC